MGYDSDIREAKKQLVGLIACEFRYQLWAPLVSVHGVDGTIALLNDAERIAKKNANSISWKTLIGK
jgi:hypothetical protein